jgi:hypothetical protein
MRLRVIVDSTFVVSRLYRRGEEFEALTWEGISQEAVEVVSGAPAPAPRAGAAPVRRPVAATAPGTSLAVEEEAKAAKLAAMLE